MSYESDVSASFQRRPNNFSTLVATLKVCTENPELSNSERISLSGLTSASYYRALETLKAKGLLTFEGNPRRAFTLPDQITKGILPPVGWKVTHLVSYLTRFKPDEVVQPYGLTVAEILQQVKDELLSNPMLGADIIYGLQQRLALLAIATGDLSPFKNMLGKITPPENLQDLL